MRLTLIGAALIALPLLAGCADRDKVVAAYTAEASFSAALSAWIALDKSGIDAKTIADINASAKAAATALHKVAEATCPQAFSDPAGDVCTPATDADITTLEAAAEAAVTSFKAVSANHGG